MELVNAACLILSVALPVGLGFLGTLAGVGGDSDWYKQLKKPPWTPPNWAFPIMWTILYIMMGVAAWQVWVQGDWYKQLKKPPWTPPNWAFPIMWTILYIMMGVAAWQVWVQGGFEKQGIPLLVYLFQLFLNFLWTPLFFGMHNPGAAFADITLLWFAIAATIYLFWHVKPVAAYLLVPYIIWVTLASTINLYVWIHYVNDSQYHVRNRSNRYSKSS